MPLAAAEREGALSKRHIERVTVDGTVQEKAVAYPTDARLLLKSLQSLVRLTRQNGITLLQSYARTAKWAARKAQNLLHRRRWDQGLRHLKWLRTRLGRVIRDIERKIDGDTDLQARFAEPLARAGIIKGQKPGTASRSRLYAFHAPEVECIGKGKAHKRFEFGVKVSVATTNVRAPGGQFVLGAMACPGNPYDGHTLKDQLEQTTRLTGATVRRAYVDREYRGHDAAEDTDVFIARQKRGLPPTIKRELKRRNAIEPVIGHMKNNGHLGRSYLKGAEGDAVNVILAAAGHNLRLLARWHLLCLLWKCVHRIWDDPKTVLMAA